MKKIIVLFALLFALTASAQKYQIYGNAGYSFMNVEPFDGGLHLAIGGEWKFNQVSALGFSVSYAANPLHVSILQDAILQGLEDASGTNKKYFLVQVPQFGMTAIAFQAYYKWNYHGLYAKLGLGGFSASTPAYEVPYFNVASAQGATMNFPGYSDLSFFYSLSAGYEIEIYKRFGLMCELALGGGTMKNISDGSFTQKTAVVGINYKF